MTCEDDSPQTEPVSSPRFRHASGGLCAFGVLGIIYGAIGLLMLAIQTYDLSTGTFVVLIALLLSVGVALFLLGRSVRRRRDWARKTGIAVYILFALILLGVLVWEGTRLAMMLLDSEMPLNLRLRLILFGMTLVAAMVALAVRSLLWARNLHSAEARRICGR